MSTSATVTIGTFCTLGVEAMESVSQPPFNAVLLDAQHGAWELHELRHAIRAAEAIGIRPIVRIPVAGEWMIESLLDAGCETLVFPMVNGAAQAKAFATACYYPPLGERSQSTCRASLRRPDYRKTFNSRFHLLVMIESVLAVENLDAILGVTGVSGCIVGPTDLASSNGGVTIDPLIERTRKTCARLNKLIGIAAPTMTQARRHIDEGYQMVFVSSDRKMLQNALDRMAGQGG